MVVVGVVIVVIRQTTVSDDDFRARANEVLAQ